MKLAQEFISEEFNKRKQRNSHFSLRSFALWLNVSPAQLSQILSGKRPVTFKVLNKICDRVGLSPMEKRVLIDSISKSPVSQESQQKQMQSLLMDENRFRLISDWFNLAILSLTKIKGSSADPRWISAKLGIAVDVANQAIQRMKTMGILQDSPNFKQIGNPFAVMSQIPSKAIQKYHRQVLEKAIDALENTPKELREFQSISLTINPRCLPEMQLLVDEFLEKADRLSEGIDPTEVYNLNVQFYPVTQIKTESQVADV